MIAYEKIQLCCVNDFHITVWQVLQGISLGKAFSGLPDSQESLDNRKGRILLLIVLTPFKGKSKMFNQIVRMQIVYRKVLSM